MWVGDNIQYEGLHDWIRRKLIKPEFCESCKVHKSYDMANISGFYLRDLNDWEWLCRRCHMDKDGRIHNLVQYAKPNTNQQKEIK